MNENPNKNIPFSYKDLPVSVFNDVLEQAFQKIQESKPKIDNYLPELLLNLNNEPDKIEWKENLDITSSETKISIKYKDGSQATISFNQNTLFIVYVQARKDPQCGFTQYNIAFNNSKQNLLVNINNEETYRGDDFSYTVMKDFLNDTVNWKEEKADQ